MCIIGALPEFTVYVPPVIIGFSVGSFGPFNYGGGAFAPEVSYDESVDAAERGIFECILNNSGGEVRTVLSAIKAQGKKIVVKDQDLPATKMGTYDRGNNLNPPVATLILDRTEIGVFSKEANPNDSVEDEKKIHARAVASYATTHTRMPVERTLTRGHPRTGTLRWGSARKTGTRTRSAARHHFCRMAWGALLPHSSPSA